MFPKKNDESTNQVVCCVFMETSWKSVIFFSRGPSFWLWNNISKTLHLTKTHMEPENYLFEKESHLPSTSIFGFHLSFRVVIFHKDATHRDSNASYDVLLSSPPTLIFPWSFVSRICLPHQKWGGGIALTRFKKAKNRTWDLQYLGICLMDFPWLVFDDVMSRVSVEVCKHFPGGVRIFVAINSENPKMQSTWNISHEVSTISRFNEHAVFCCDPVV